jgi:hypothetical protein
MSTDVAPPPTAVVSPAPAAPRGMGLLELLIVAVGLAALMLAELAVCKPRIVMDGPFWLDECLTNQIVQDPSIGHSIQAIRHGVDTNPPVYHLIARGYWKVFGRVFRDSPRVTLRSLSLLCTWLALVGVYALLRRGISIWPAVLGVLAVWAHPDVVEQAFEARFYGPLLAATVAMCLTLRIQGNSIPRGILVALTAALLCTLHYFGIIILGSICFAMVLIDSEPTRSRQSRSGSTFRGTDPNAPPEHQVRERTPWHLQPVGDRLIRLLPAAAGPIALAPFLWFVHTQAAGLTVKTWLDPYSPFLAGQFMVDVLCTLPLLAAVVAWVIGQLLPPSIIKTRSADRQPLLEAAVPLLAMVLVPIAIIVFSATVQSALRPRYAIAAALILAPITAMLAAPLGRYVLVGVAIALSSLTVMKLHGEASYRETQLQVLTDNRDTLESQSPALPIYLTDRGNATELLNFAPELFPRMHLLDLRKRGIYLTNYRLYETRMIGKVNAFYPLPPLVRVDRLEGVGKFNLIAPNEDMLTLLQEQPLDHIDGMVYRATVISKNIPADIPRQ